MKVSELFDQQADNRSFVKHTMLPSTCMVGVEVELEGARSVPSDATYWEVVDDPSLRNSGVEIRMRQPLCGQDYVSAMRELATIIQVLGDPVCSDRTSVHVHMDCRALSTDQVMRIVVAYAICEAGLFTVCGKSRYENIYCPGLTSSYTQVEELARLYSLRNAGRFPFTERVMEYSKYSSVNLNALATQGSIEFRGHEGTTSAVRITGWVMLLMSLREYALTISSEDMLTEAEQLGPTAFAARVFGKRAPAVLDKDNWARYFHTNLMNAKDIVYKEQWREMPRNYSTTEKVSTGDASAEQVLDAVREYIASLED